MTTVTAGNTSSFQLGPFDTVTVSAGSARGQFALTSQAPKLVADQVLSVASGTFGPWGAPMSVVLSVAQGSVDYTVNTQSLGVAQSVAAAALVSDAGVYNVINLAGLRRWRRAFADQLFAAQQIICLGDSTTFGTGSAGTGSETNATARAPSCSGQLKSMFGKLSPRSRESGYIHAVETDLVTVSNAQAVVTTIGIAGFSQGLNSTGPGTLTFAIPPCTYVDLCYWENNDAAIGGTTGTFTYNLDGAGATAVGAPALSNTFKTITLTVSDSTAVSHSLVVIGTNANSARILGVRYYDAGGVCVGRFGKPGWTLADIMGYGVQNLVSAGNRPRIASSLTQYGTGGLLVLPISINEFSRQGNGSNTDNGSGETYTSPNYLSAQLDLAINQWVTAGGCVLLVGPGQTSAAESNTPSSGAGPTGLKSWTEYLAVLQAKAAAGSNVAYMSFTSRWGGYTQANTDGLMYDVSHPTRRGYGDQANAIFNVLQVA